MPDIFSVVILKNINRCVQERTRDPKAKELEHYCRDFESKFNALHLQISSYVKPCCFDKTLDLQTFLQNYAAILEQIDHVQKTICGIDSAALSPQILTSVKLYLLLLQESCYAYRSSTYLLHYQEQTKKSKQDKQFNETSLETKSYKAHGLADIDKEEAVLVEMLDLCEGLPDGVTRSLFVAVADSRKVELLQRKDIYKELGLFLDCSSLVRNKLFYTLCTDVISLICSDHYGDQKKRVEDLLSKLFMTQDALEENKQDSRSIYQVKLVKQRGVFSDIFRTKVQYLNVFVNFWSSFDRVTHSFEEIDQLKEHIAVAKRIQVQLDGYLRFVSPHACKIMPREDLETIISSLDCFRQSMNTALNRAHARLKEIEKQNDVKASQSSSKQRSEPFAVTETALSYCKGSYYSFKEWQYLSRLEFAKKLQQKIEYCCQSSVRDDRSVVKCFDDYKKMIEEEYAQPGEDGTIIKKKMDELDQLKGDLLQFEREVMSSSEESFDDDDETLRQKVLFSICDIKSSLCYFQSKYYYEDALMRMKKESSESLLLEDLMKVEEAINDALEACDRGSYWLSEIAVENSSEIVLLYIKKFHIKKQLLEFTLLLNHKEVQRDLFEYLEQAIDLYVNKIEKGKLADSILQKNLDSILGALNDMVELVCQGKVSRLRVRMLLDKRWAFLSDKFSDEKLILIKKYLYPESLFEVQLSLAGSRCKEKFVIDEIRRACVQCYQQYLDDLEDWSVEEQKKWLSILVKQLGQSTCNYANMLQEMSVMQLGSKVAKSRFESGVLVFKFDVMNLYVLLARAYRMQLEDESAEKTLKRAETLLVKTVKQTKKSAICSMIASEIADEKCRLLLRKEKAKADNKDVYSDDAHRKMIALIREAFSNLLTIPSDTSVDSDCLDSCYRRRVSLLKGFYTSDVDEQQRKLLYELKDEQRLPSCVRMEISRLIGGELENNGDQDQESNRVQDAALPQSNKQRKRKKTQRPTKQERLDREARKKIFDEKIRKMSEASRALIVSERQRRLKLRKERAEENLCIEEELRQKRCAKREEVRQARLLKKQFEKAYLLQEDKSDKNKRDEPKPGQKATNKIIKDIFKSIKYEEQPDKDLVRVVNQALKEWQRDSQLTSEVANLVQTGSFTVNRLRKEIITFEHHRIQQSGNCGLKEITQKKLNDVFDFLHAITILNPEYFSEKIVTEHAHLIYACFYQAACEQYKFTLAREMQGSKVIEDGNRRNFIYYLQQYGTFAEIPNSILEQLILKQTESDCLHGMMKVMAMSYKPRQRTPEKYPIFGSTTNLFPRSRYRYDYGTDKKGKHGKRLLEYRRPCR